MILNYPSQFTDLMSKIRGNTEVGIQADDLEEFIATWRKANPVTSAVVAAADGKEAEQVNNPEAADDKEADTTTAKVAKLAQLTVIDLASDVAVFQEHVETVPAHYFFAHTHATYTQAAVTQRHTETHRDTHTHTHTHNTHTHTHTAKRCRGRYNSSEGCSCQTPRKETSAVWRSEVPS
jgi:hypothetical protein